jgi:hypothetical protein
MGKVKKIEKKEQDAPLVEMTNKGANELMDMLSKTGKLRGVRFGIMVNKNMRIIKDELKELTDRGAGPDWLKEKRKEIYDSLEDKSKGALLVAINKFLNEPGEEFKEKVEAWEKEAQEIEKEWLKPFEAYESLRKVHVDDVDNDAEVMLVSALLDYGLIIEDE